MAMKECVESNPDYYGSMAELEKEQEDEASSDMSESSSEVTQESQEASEKHVEVEKPADISEKPVAADEKPIEINDKPVAADEKPTETNVVPSEEPSPKEPSPVNVYIVYSFQTTVTITYYSESHVSFSALRVRRNKETDRGTCLPVLYHAILQCGQ